jgi:hypothetical protein
LEDEASACEAAFEMLSSGKLHAGSIWDVIYLLIPSRDLRKLHASESKVASTPDRCVIALHA